MATVVHPQQTLQQRIVAGIIGGLAGGVIFGIMMAAMGMMPMIAMLIGSESVLVGWVIHFLISAFIGATFGVLLGGTSTNVVRGLGWGLAYGALWWVLGPLLIMPALMGMPLLMIDGMTLMSLVGHLIYGAILGVVYVWYAQR